MDRTGIRTVLPIAYELYLSSHSHSPRFHCSKVKAHKGLFPLLLMNFPLIPLIYNNPIIAPLAILNFKDDAVDGTPTHMALVERNGLYIRN